MQLSRRESGASLIEAILIIVILGTTVVAGLALLGYQSDSSQDQALAWQAQGFLQREYEWVRAMPFIQLRTTAFEPVDEDPTFEIQHVLISADATTREVEVRIRWTTHRGVVRTRSVSTIRCREVDA